MIKATELRIGNYVNYFSGTLARQIDNYTVSASDICCLTGSVAHAEGIPLTEEWLLKFGFVKRKMYGYDQHFAYHHHKLHSSITALYNSDFSICLDNVARGVVYVHRLQNLYFALTGEELTIKEMV